MTEEEKKYDGDVIWYNERRGYGFVRFEKDEIFLHHSALSRFRPETVYPGDQLSVYLDENERDIFVHLRTLRNCGIHHLTEGQEILLHVTDEGKGPQAKEVKVFATD